MPKGMTVKGAVPQGARLQGAGQGGGQASAPRSRRERDESRSQSYKNRNGEAPKGQGRFQQKTHGQNQNSASRQSKYENLLAPKTSKAFFDKKKGAFVERLKWAPVKQSAEPIPELICKHCQKKIEIPAEAIGARGVRQADEGGVGDVFHVECVIQRLRDGERLEAGEEIAYIGGGRFGVVQRDDNRNLRNFKIKKIIDWEIGYSSMPWRQNIADHFSQV
jgi:hypothetical protein